MKRNALYKQLIAEVLKNPRFKVQGYLRDNHPQVLNDLREANQLSAKQQVTFEHVFKWAHPKSVGKCKTCTEPTKFDANQKKFKDYCSTSCVQNSPEVRKKKEQTNLARRGTAWPTQSAEVRAKVTATNLAKFGHEHAAQSEKSKRKAVKTNMSKRGVANASQSEEVKKAKRDTNLKRTGGKHTTPFSDPKAMAKARRTMLRKYGAPNPGQSVEILARAQKTRYASYACKVGARSLRMQGYEDMAVRRVLKWGVPSKAVHANDSVLWYTHAGSKRAYHPDFRMRHRNQEIVVEVKSTYTSGMQSEGKLWPEVMAKAKAVVKSGKPFLLLVMRPLKRSEKGYSKDASKGEREGRIVHFMFSTPKRLDWKLHSSREAKRELKQRLHAWVSS